MLNNKTEIENHFYKQLYSILDSLPINLSLIDNKLESAVCNKTFLELFGLESTDEIDGGIHALFPEFQPDGRRSEDIAKENIEKVYSEGEMKFYWLHQKLNGEQIQTEVTLTSIDVIDEYGRPVLVWMVRDLRKNEFENSEDDNAMLYFDNYISDKMVVTSIAELSAECFFILDLKASLIKFIGRGAYILGLSDENQPFPENLIENGKIYKDDINILNTIIENIRNNFCEPMDIRFVLPNGMAHYYRIAYRMVNDKNGNPIFCVGKATDIHNEKSLEILSQTDLLTNCYNKITSEILIKEIVSKNKDCMHAMFIVDIDNFKAVNDNLGHHFGDIVLSDIATELRSCFRDSDVVGRIGGDEFIVFVKNTRDLRVIESKAKAISKAFKNNYSGENKDYKVSGSIGISMYPKDGTNYEDLYKAADKALYQSKLSGKDRFTFYSDELVDGTMKNRTILDNASRIADTYFDSEMVSTVFDLMYETNEMRSSINAVMQFVCKRTKSDRCYIFETFDGGVTYDNTYEWCQDSVEPEIDNLKGLTAEVLEDFFNSSDENGIFYSNDLKLLVADGAYELMYNQGIKSFLHIQIKEKGYVKLFVGLDDCTKTRVWSPKEINSMLYATKMISIFLLQDDRSKRVDND